MIEFHVLRVCSYMGGDLRERKRKMIDLG